MQIRKRLGTSDDGDRQMVKILTTVLSDGMDPVEAACTEALGEGVHSADVILNILARRKDPAPALAISTPEALKLKHEPLANCDRYDQLRKPNDGTIRNSQHDEHAQALRHESGL